ncbi:MAG: hypothetical protein ACM3ZV_13645 [Bacillota bacterium]
MRAASICGIAAAGAAVAALGACGKGREEARNPPSAQPSVEPGSNATPTTDSSFQLLGADVPTRLATLQAVIAKAGNKCASVTRGVLAGGLDGTDEWRVDCSDSGRWQIWFSEDADPQVEHCADAKCA